MSDEPFVSVLTPVYNGAEFLAACIESVLRQTHKNFEYIIVNNRSKDRTLEIATSYAAKDPRISVRTNETFVPVIENHNIAFRLISPDAKYCKIVSADDGVFPDCFRKLVELAERHPSVAMVGCYQQSGKDVRWQGFPYPQEVMKGRDVGREILVRNEPTFGFGSPTSLLYRAAIIRENPEFYPDPSPHSDTSACFKHLAHADFGFIYQVLCWEQMHEQTQSFASAGLNRYSSAYLNDVLRFGNAYLNEKELEEKVKQILNWYYEFLAVNLFTSRGKDFWQYHRGRLAELGHPITVLKLLKAGIAKAGREVVNPGLAISKLQKQFRHS